mmetsp:Transcript_5244/g.10741  ORF Transcript_5244/g.10741 Transcript_5244/m.10741 type:complete len:242 (-) Transcript_5244:630-1355(-)
MQSRLHMTFHGRAFPRLRWWFRHLAHHLRLVGTHPVLRNRLPQTIVHRKFRPFHRNPINHFFRHILQHRDRLQYFHTFPSVLQSKFHSRVSRAQFRLHMTSLDQASHRLQLLFHHQAPGRSLVDTHLFLRYRLLQTPIWCFLRCPGCLLWHHLHYQFDFHSYCLQPLPCRHTWLLIHGSTLHSRDVTERSRLHKTFHALAFLLLLLWSHHPPHPLHLDGIRLFLHCRLRPTTTMTLDFLFQ